MLIIGLTGGIGSGKSTVARLFAQKGIHIIDADQIAKEVVSPGTLAYNKIVEKFGPEVLSKNQTLNRAYVRKIIFADPHKKIWLETLLHPIIRAEMKKQIEQATSPYCLAIIPLLLETKPDLLVHRILVIDALETQQISRAKTRDQVSETEINAIMQTQISREKRLAAADDIIFNHGLLDELSDQVDQMHALYLSLAES